MVTALLHKCAEVGVGCNQGLGSFPSLDVVIVDFCIFVSLLAVNNPPRKVVVLESGGFGKEKYGFQVLHNTKGYQPGAPGSWRFGLFDTPYPEGCFWIVFRMFSRVSMVIHTYRSIFSFSRINRRPSFLGVGAWAFLSLNVLAHGGSNLFSGRRNIFVKVFVAAHVALSLALWARLW